MAEPLRSESVSQKPGEVSERVSREVERQAARVPSAGFISLAVGSMLVSAGIEIFSERKHLANFIGLWVPSLLLVGIYNKLLRMEGRGQSFTSGRMGERMGERIGERMGGERTGTERFAG